MLPVEVHLLTLSRTTWGIFTPLRKHLIWGIPLPAATGWKEKEVNTELAKLSSRRPRETQPHGARDGGRGQRGTG